MTEMRFVPIVSTCALLLAACGSVDGPAVPAASEAPLRSQATASGTEASFRSQATAIAKAWQDRGITTAWTTGFIPLEDLQVGPDFSANHILKAAYANGWIRTSSPLSDVTGRGVIRFADGTSLSVPLVGAKTAYRQLPHRTGPCPTEGRPPTCRWLTISEARLSTVKITTSRGPANVPAWRYTIAGLRQPLLRVAVTPSVTTSLPEVEQPGPNTPERIVPAMKLAASRGDSVAFDIGIGACDKDARGLVMEFPGLIVIGGSVKPTSAGCTLQLLSHRVEVRTKQAVGRRPIVDALSGQPLLNEQVVNKP